ncbi:MAG TPA: RNA polymerase sigma factor [Candidatus Paceibacterota bacterium]
MIDDEKKKQFTEFYNREADALFRFVSFRVAIREQVLDIVQESFTKFWLVFMENKPINNHRAFLFTIARNQIIDWYRKIKPASLNEMMEENSNHYFPEPIDQKESDWLKLSAEAHLVTEALKKLPSKYREAVHLRLIEDLKPQEIAEIIGIATNAVSVRINRGINELRKLLGISKNHTNL